MESIPPSNYLGRKSNNNSSAQGSEENQEVKNCWTNTMEDIPDKFATQVSQGKLIAEIQESTELIVLFLIWLISTILVRAIIKRTGAPRLPPSPLAIPILGHLHLLAPILHQAAVKETLRLHLTGPLIVRESTETCTIGGYEIPAKTRLFVNVWARDPKHWENPLEFRPERFVSEEGSGKSQLDASGQHFHPNLCTPKLQDLKPLFYEYLALRS